VGSLYDSSVYDVSLLWHGYDPCPRFVFPLQGGDNEAPWHTLAIMMVSGGCRRMNTMRTRWMRVVR